MNPEAFLFMHSIVCPITHSFLDGFQPNLVQHFPHVSYYFQFKKHLDVFVKGYYTAG